MIPRMVPTKGNARVFVSHVVALFVGEEHVRGESTLWCIGVCWVCQLMDHPYRGNGLTFLFLTPFGSRLSLGLAR